MRQQFYRNARMTTSILSSIRTLFIFIFVLLLHHNTENVKHIGVYGFDVQLQHPISQFVRINHHHQMTTQCTTLFNSQIHRMITPPSCRSGRNRRKFDCLYSTKNNKNHPNDTNLNDTTTTACTGTVTTKSLSLTTTNAKKTTSTTTNLPSSDDDKSESNTMLQLLLQSITSSKTSDTASSPPLSVSWGNIPIIQSVQTYLDTISDGWSYPMPICILIPQKHSLGNYSFGPISGTVSSDISCYKNIIIVRLGYCVK